MAIICLITPGHLGSNPRIVKEADALSNHGHQVHVVYAQTHRRDLDRDASILENAGWQAHPISGFAGSMGHRFRRLRQLAAAAGSRLWPHSVRLATSAQHPLASRLIRAATAIQADLYIAHYVAALPAAARASRSHGSRYAFDAEDFHLGEWPSAPAFDHRRQIIRTIEAAFLKGCYYVSAASPGIADAYHDSYGISRPSVVHNVFPLNQAPSGPAPCGTVQPGPTVYWFSQTIGPDRGLECAVRALAMARSQPHLHLRGFVRCSYRDQLVALAQQLGVEQRLHLHPPAPPEQMERLAAPYDVGLVAETGCTPNRRIALTNKLFTYALAGIPMLLSDIPAHREIQAEAGAAARLFRREDPASLAQALDGWLDGPPAVLAQARKAAYRLGQEHWNWEREQALLLEQVSAVLHRQSSDHERSPS